MATYAIINSDNIVINVVKLSNDITTVNGVEDGELGVQYFEEHFGTDNTYVQFFKTDPENLKAHPGDTYDPSLKAFISPQPYPSWTYSTTNKQWEPPIPKPNEGSIWSEANARWFTEEEFSTYYNNTEGDQCEIQNTL